jgi:hypothetical protein
MWTYIKKRDIVWIINLFSKCFTGNFIFYNVPLISDYLLGLLFDPEDGGTMFLRNVGVTLLWELQIPRRRTESPCETHSCAFDTVRVYHSTDYEGESVNRSQVDINRKTCDIRTWEKLLFLDISSTNTDTHVPSLYRCFETRSRAAFLLLSQPLPR